MIRLSILIACALVSSSLAIARPLPSSSELHGNVERNGYLDAEFPPPYHAAWRFAPHQPPRPAWPDPAWEVNRLTHDQGFPLAIGHGQVYVASSSDHALRALDLATGAVRWIHITGAPLRTVPVVWNDLVLVAGDDGRLLALDHRDGHLRWEFWPAIPDRWLIGNEQVMSRWPARAGVVVRDGKCYVAFGLWSEDGVYLACLDAATGREIWRNDTSGMRLMTRPHFEAMGGLSPEGHFALDGRTLVVPCGRATPALVDAETGKLLWHEAEGAFAGGDCAMIHKGTVWVPSYTLAKGSAFTPSGGADAVTPSLVCIDARTGEQRLILNGGSRVVADQAGNLVLWDREQLRKATLAEVLDTAAKTKPTTIKHSIGRMVVAGGPQLDVAATALLQIGETLLVGTKDRLLAVDVRSFRATWEAPMRSAVSYIAAADGAIVVSTQGGEIACFRQGAAGGAASTLPKVVKQTPGHDPEATLLLSAVGQQKGYAVLLGPASATLLAGLAAGSELQIVHAHPEAPVEELRRELLTLGLNGSRVVTHQVTYAPLPYANYMADVLWVTAGAEIAAREVYRIVRPYGGAALIQGNGEELARVYRAAGVPAGEISAISGGILIRRGALEGAADWSHPYADAGRSTASTDRLVRLPLEPLWFGGLGPAAQTDRHARPAVPLVVQGRLFSAGFDTLTAQRVHNGRILWQRTIPGIGRWPVAYRGGPIAADETSVYAIDGVNCLRLDAETGTTLATYRMPMEQLGLGQAARQASAEKPRKGKAKAASSSSRADDPKVHLQNQRSWDALLVQGRFVVGTVGDPNIRTPWWSQAFPVGHALVVFDRESAQVLWQWKPQRAIDPMCAAIANGLLFCVDGLSYSDIDPNLAAARTLVAFDLAAGRELWRVDGLPKHCCQLLVQDGVVVACGGNTGNSSRGGEGGPVLAFDFQGKPLYTVPAGGGVKPFLLEGALYLPDAFDLKTGNRLTALHPLTGDSIARCPSFTGAGCGRFSAAPNLIMQRHGGLGFYDLEHDGGTFQYSSVRAGCWMNMIPACGVVAVPDSTGSCTCGYPFRTSVVYAPSGRESHWGIYNPPQSDATKRRGAGSGGKRASGKAADASEPIERLAINLGAPGDRVDDEGNLWLAYPRPDTNGPRGAAGMNDVRGMEIPLTATLPEGGWYGRNPDWLEIAGQSRPWLASFGWEGPLSLDVELGTQEPRLYRVSLHAWSHDGASRRFTVEVAGKAVPVQVPATGSVIVATEVRTANTLRLRVQPEGKPTLAAVEVVRVQ
ncbi:MAG: PQQ-binding-like beta-propeller repeat protein [Planctomycetota bacterium]